MQESEEAAEQESTPRDKENKTAEGPARNGATVTENNSEAAQNGDAAAAGNNEGKPVDNGPARNGATVTENSSESSEP